MSKPHYILEDLREIREANKLTQAELGNASGYNRASIIRYESGQTDPNLMMVSNIAEALGYELVLRPKK